MSSNHSNKLYKVNRRPKDAVSDDEDEIQNVEHKYNNQLSSDTENNSDSMSICLVPAIPFPYIDYIGQQCFTWIQRNDIAIGYNYTIMDKDWFLWCLQVNNLSPTQFLWIQGKKSPQYNDLAKNECFIKQIAMIIRHNLKSNPSLQLLLKPTETSIPIVHEVIHSIKSNIPQKDDSNITVFGST